MVGGHCPQPSSHVISPCLLEHQAPQELNHAGHSLQGPLLLLLAPAEHLGCSTRAFNSPPHLSPPPPLISLLESLLLTPNSLDKLSLALSPVSFHAMVAMSAARRAPSPRQPRQTTPSPPCLPTASPPQSHAGIKTPPLLVLSAKSSSGTPPATTTSSHRFRPPLLLPSLPLDSS